MHFAVLSPNDNSLLSSLLYRQPDQEQTLARGTGPCLVQSFQKISTARSVLEICNDHRCQFLTSSISIGRKSMSSFLSMILHVFAFFLDNIRSSDIRMILPCRFASYAQKLLFRFRNHKRNSIALYRLYNFLREKRPLNDRIFFQLNQEFLIP